MRAHGTPRLTERSDHMNAIVKILANSPLLRKDIEYHLLRGAMVLIFLIFGYAKWFKYDVDLLAPFITHGPLISWLYPVFGPQGATWFLGASEWTFGALLFIGFWDKRAGVLGAIGSIVTFVATVTIIPVMTVNIAFVMKDWVLLAVSVYLLKQDVIRLSLATGVKSISDKSEFASRRL